MAVFLGSDVPTEQVKSIEIVLDAVDDYIRMMHDDLDLLLTGNLSQLFTGQMKRQQMLGRIKQSFAGIPGATWGKSAGLYSAFKEKMGEMQYAEKKLMLEVVKQKEMLQQKVGKIRKGKRVLSCYGMKGGLGSPRFVSSMS